MEMTTAGIVVGWLGSALLAVNLLLMVREPSLAARLGGLERMYHWHHRLGTLAYALLLAHPLLLAMAAWPGDRRAAWTRIAPALEAGMLLGWGAMLALMAGLAVTFIVRMRYGLWRLLHMLLGIGVLLGAAHVVVIGGLSTGSMLMTAVAMLALAWRGLRADRGGSSRPYEVSAVAHPSANVIDAAIRPLAAPIDVAPGQFIMAAFFEGPGFDGCGEFHPYTVSGMAGNGALNLSIKSLGDCTRNIQALVPGVAVRVQGPYGRFMVERADADEIWIAGGIGITPFLATLRAAPVRRATDLFYVFRDRGDAPYLDELASAAAAQPALRLHALALGQDPAPLLAGLGALPGLSTRMIYMSGPPPLIDAVTGWLREHGVAADRIHFERFDFR
jgi:predicted ferric reductase